MSEAGMQREAGPWEGALDPLRAWDPAWAGACTNLNLVQNALQAGATMEEVMEVLKLCVAQGIQACNLGVPILAEELARQNQPLA